VSSSVFSSSTAITIAGTATSSGIYNFATGPTAASSTKTINIGTNGVFGSTTDVNIGSANTTAGTTTVNNNLVVRGDFTVQGTTATVNSTTLDVKDTNITLNKGGTSVTAEGSGLTIEGTGASSLARVLYDSSLASRFKVGPNGSESEVLTTQCCPDDYRQQDL
jgi:hypothetical protein